MTSELPLASCIDCFTVSSWFVFMVFISVMSVSHSGKHCRNTEFQQSVKELKEKAEELKGVKEDLKVR